MVKPRRLFLFAGYDAVGIIDAAEVMYVSALARFGDVVYVMDSDAPKSEIAKIKKIPHVLYAHAARHGEYDFGSYKRAYLYARDHGILDNYDIIYMVNNSVYGPLFDMSDIMRRMDALNVSAFGPALHIKRDRRNLESWFIGMRRDVFATDWFDEFMSSVTRQSTKGAVIYKYELGFSRAVAAHGLAFDGVYKCPGAAVYNRVRWLFRCGMPFMKRCAFTRHGGSIGRQVRYIMNHVDANVRDAVLDNARRVYGAVVDRNLRGGPIRMAYRLARYGIKKITGGKK